MLAVPHVPVIFNKAKNPASHEDMGMRAVIGLDLVKILVPPIDTIFAVDHGILMREFGCRNFTVAVP
jgi:hypothetical protein